MTHLTRVLAKVMMGLVVTIRSADPDGIAPDSKAELTEGAIRILRTGMGHLREEDRLEMIGRFREHAEYLGAPELKPYALEFHASMRLASEEPHDTGGRPPAHLDRVLAEAVMDVLNGLESADDDTIDEDDAVKFTEWYSGDLRIGMEQAPEEDRQHLIRLFREIAADEEDPERKELALDFPEAMGLVTED